jgi:hypothetical protein
VFTSCLILALLAIPCTAVAEDGPETAPLKVEGASRPAGLVPLYVSFAGLQAIDIHSTLRGLDRGAQETNPVVRGIVDSPAAFVAFKTGATLATVYLTEKLWKRHRKAAILTMIGANVTYGLIASHNYAVSRRSVK